jgi:hypothetical protein
LFTVPNTTPFEINVTTPDIRLTITVSGDATLADTGDVVDKTLLLFIKN